MSDDQEIDSRNDDADQPKIIVRYVFGRTLKQGYLEVSQARVALRYSLDAEQPITWQSAFTVQGTTGLSGCSQLMHMQSNQPMELEWQDEYGADTSRVQVPTGCNARSPMMCVHEIWRRRIYSPNRALKTAPPEEQESTKNRFQPMKPL